MYTENAEADRAFFRDILEFPSVDAGHGWLIFSISPAEAAFHPIEEEKRQMMHAGHRMLDAVLYLMCDDLKNFVASLKAKKISCTEIEEENWGIRTTIKLPSGGEIGLYQPTHPTALNLKKK